LSDKIKFYAEPSRFFINNPSHSPLENGRGNKKYDLILVDAYS
jgi:hypothetical protein